MIVNNNNDYNNNNNNSCSGNNNNKIIIPIYIQSIIIIKLLNQERNNNQYGFFNNNSLITLSLVSKEYFKIIINLNKSMDFITDLYYKKQRDGFIQNGFQCLMNNYYRRLCKDKSIFNFYNITQLYINLDYHHDGLLSLLKYFDRAQKLQMVKLKYTFSPVVNCGNSSCMQLLYNIVQVLDGISNISIQIEIVDNYNYPQLKESIKTNYKSHNNRYSINSFKSVQSVVYIINQSLLDKPYLSLIINHLVCNHKVNSIQYQDSLFNSRFKSAFKLLFQNLNISSLVLDCSIHISDLSNWCSNIYNNSSSSSSGGGSSSGIGSEHDSCIDSGGLNILKHNLYRCNNIGSGDIRKINSLNHLNHLDITLNTYQEPDNKNYYLDWIHLCSLFKINTSIKTLILRDNFNNSNSNQNHKVNIHSSVIEMVSRVIKFALVFKYNKSITHIGLGGFYDNILIVESLKEILHSTSSSITSITLFTTVLNNKQTTFFSSEIISLLCLIVINKPNITNLNISSSSFTDYQINQLQYICDVRDINLNLNNNKKIK